MKTECALNNKTHAYCYRSIPSSRCRAKRRPQAIRAELPQQTLRSPPSEKRIQLLQALTEQARRDTTPWLGDLVIPWIGGAPPPLRDTYPPQSLADSDSRFIDVEGIKVHYKQSGPASSEGPAILLLHGFNGSVFNWRHVLDPLSNIAASSLLPAEGFRVVAFDRPPFGLTERPTNVASTPGSFNPYSNEGAAKLAFGLMDKLGIGQAVVVGHSAGSGVAMEMVKSCPDRVSGLVLLCPALPDGSSTTARFNFGSLLRLVITQQLLRGDDTGVKYVRRVIGRRKKQLLSGDMRVHSDDALLTQDVIDGYLMPLKARDWDRGMLFTMRTFSLSSPPPDYVNLQQPVLILQGQKDEPLATRARKISSILEERKGVLTRYVELQGIGHIPQEECPGQVVSVMEPFLMDVFNGNRQDAAAELNQQQGQKEEGVENQPKVQNTQAKRNQQKGQKEEAKGKQRRNTQAKKKQQRGKLETPDSTETK